MPHILIVEARFYADLADMLALGATRVLENKGHTFERIKVPGALEIPAAIALALESGRYDGFIALGCVIRGETYHFEIVCNESARGLMELTTYRRAAIGNGILTVNNRKQAEERADPAKANKGADAAQACLDLIQIARKYGVTNR